MDTVNDGRECFFFVFNSSCGLRDHIDVKTGQSMASSAFCKTELGHVPDGFFDSEAFI